MSWSARGSRQAGPRSGQAFASRGIVQAVPPGDDRQPGGCPHPVVVAVAVVVGLVEPDELISEPGDPSRISVVGGVGAIVDVVDQNRTRLVLGLFGEEARRGGRGSASFRR